MERLETGARLPVLRHHPAMVAGRVKCGSCHAISVFDSHRAAQRCDFCGSPSIVPADDLRDLITPESLLPAAVPNTEVRAQLREWYGSRWFAPNRLKGAALTDTLQGVYLPYWTFDAQVDAEWTAESGYYYYVTETFRGSGGRTQTRQVRKIRWQPSAGSLSHFFDDDAVPATVGVHTVLLRKVEPFPTLTDLKPYDPAFIRGWTVERYQIDLPATYRGRTFKHILVPVWLVSYNYGRKSYQCVVNGYTGKMAGEHPYSWIKITLAVLAVVLIVLLIALANR